MRYFRAHIKGFLFIILGITLAIFLSQNKQFHVVLQNLGGFGYIGAFIAGMLFVSTFTVASAVLILVVLSQQLSPLPMSIIAGLGATIGNYLIFLFIKEKVSYHIHKFAKTKKKHRHTLFQDHSHWLLPFAGILIMASPLPDELGILLLSIFKMKTYQFLIISFALKTAGIFALVSNAGLFS